MVATFHSEMREGYALNGPGLVLGSPMLEGDILTDVRAQLSLAMANRHGLICGATGTGKTRTLQLLAGQLSEQGVPVFVADVKGDLTGLAAPGAADDPRLQERIRALDWTFRPSGHPIELLSLSGALGAQVRASVHSFGPLLLARILDLNETQAAVLSLVFKYCDDHDLALLDLADLATTLRYLASDEARSIREEYGGISGASVGVVLRALVTLEQEGADVFFGEPAFEVTDLLRLTAEGKGVISLLELPDVMARPRLFSTFMLWLLAQLYQALPEAGDLPRPRLAFFFDEAHLLFDDAPEPLLEQVELTVRLIRSKGVGVFFVTQAPTDVPASVLAQLGSRVQHAMRAFTPQDADVLRKTARTFPFTDHYDVERTLTSLGIGEALVTALSPRGVPTPLAATMLLPPDSLMGSLPEAELAATRASGRLRARYATTVDRESAHEIIGRRLAAARAAAAAAAGVTMEEAATMTPAELRAARRRHEGAQARALRETQRQAVREARERLAEAKRIQSEQLRMAREEQAARERAYRAMARRGARTSRSRSGSRGVRRSGSDPATDVLRTLFGTLFGSG